MRQYAIIFLFLSSFIGFSQYTDVINSNRPGQSVSAYAVGKNVLQLEMGAGFEQSDHALLNTQSNIWGSDISLRYGLLFERLELNWEATFQNEAKTFVDSGIKSSLNDFSRNRLGLKFLLYDRYKNPERNKPNLYSWRKNNLFQLKNLIPSVALYGGATFNLLDNPNYLGDPTVSYRVMLATQSRLTPRFVLISNISYDRITSLYPELGYMVSLSYAFRNPKWSSFIEHQGFKSDRYSDILLRGGVAHLLNDGLQVDVNMGASFKNTPSRIFIAGGFSYRFDFHKDPPAAIEDQKAGENGGPIKKNAMKKKDKAKNKQADSGTGAEDIDLGPNKKQLRKIKKNEKKKKKNKVDDGVIEF